MKQYIGLDIGGTKCAVVLGGETGKILKKEVFATDHSVSPEENIRHMERIIREMGVTPDGIGISCGGPLDAAEGVILSPPNLPGWDNVPIVQMLKDSFGCPVQLENDANACALAEWRFGAGRGSRHMIFLTFGTGLGAGLILDGRLYRGANDMAGEAGHIRLAEHGPVGYGKEGSFEGFCSGNGIAQLAEREILKRKQQGNPVAFWNGEEPVTAKLVAQAAEAGDADAIEIYRICAHYLGRGLAVLIDILNPERIVIGSVFQRSEGLLREEMERMIAKEALPRSAAVCKVVPAELKENLGDMAALATIIE